MKKSYISCYSFSVILLFVWNTENNRVSSLAFTNNNIVKSSFAKIATKASGGGKAITTTTTTNNDSTSSSSDLLNSLQIPDGLRNTLLSNADTVCKRFWIIDNSGSMAMHDGHLLLGPTDVVDNNNDRTTTRWKEVEEVVNVHALLSASIDAPTEFRLLNPPKRGQAQKFRVGYGSANNNKRALTKDLKRAKSIMLSSKPHGMTPLPTSISQVRKEIIEMLPQLQAEQTKVAIVIATDGSNYNKDNIGVTDEALLHEELIDALETLHDLPVCVVIRLCTDYQPLIDFYNELDTKLDIHLDVLDDYVHESQEVYQHNKWLNYAMIIHRMREMGQDNELFGLLDERPFTKTEIRDFCILLFGKDAIIDADNDADWLKFIKHIHTIQQKEKLQFNPRTQQYEPWINIEELALLDAIIVE